MRESVSVLSATADPARLESRRGRAVAAVAGPALIVASVLVLLHDFAFRGMVSVQHVDPLGIWLPLHCYLGKTIAAGHVPAWNPYTMGGVPFAADPQSGWMYLPVMLLYAALPCEAAIRWMIVLQPVVGGLGLYWFFRDQGTSRPSATVGGLLLAMAVASSRIAVALPFAGSLAWTAVLLACGSRYLSARTWPSRLVWAAATGVVWSQLAAAHMSHGLLIGTAALASYAAARTFVEVRAGRRSGRETLALAGLLVVALPLVSLAFFLPRLAYLPRTSLAQGYQRLAELAEGLAGRRAGPLRPGFSATAQWPLTFSTSTGVYLGAAALAVSFAGWWSRRHRHLAVAFGGFAAVCYVLSLRGFAELVAPAVRPLPFGDFYLHEPSRFRYGVLLALMVAIPLGLEAWRTASRPGERLRMIVPGIVVWGLLPVLAGAFWQRLVLLAAGAIAGGAALWLASRRPALTWAVCAVLAVELLANGLLGQAHRTQAVQNGIIPAKERVPFTMLLEPETNAAAYLRAGPIVRALQRAGTTRYLSLDPSRSGTRGHLLSQTPRDWGLMANHRSVLFRVEEAQGYNPVQSLRYWLFVRAAESKKLRYNAAVFLHPPNSALDLLQVGYVVGPTGRPPLSGTAVATAGRWTLYRLRVIPPRASVVTSWTVTQPGPGLWTVANPGFDPSQRVVLEEDPGLPTGGETGQGTAIYRQLGPQAAEVTVDAPGPAIVLVRTVWDPGWRAFVDGRPAPVLTADYLLQGVPVPGGRHTVLLRYDDPWLGYGLLGSALALAGLLGAAASLWWAGRRREGPARTGS